ncbi:hypothetical protein N1031_13260 [Herbiconiux moechotypicola]|uniref:hypothetical protein n=1 Tax=Herbiconiux moechotypicola TaxID=637393 RepID=UPI00217D9D48|nr:hypothetical protein [Herbiconiux moechotypicola]MCS5730732.1 hypothetical protein [Herbiconiux moechotypicola]
MNIKYGGSDYSIGGRGVDDIQSEIDAGIASGHPAWLHVNAGEGQYQPARLLLAPGVSIALIAVDEERQGPEFTHDPA